MIPRVTLPALAPLALALALNAAEAIAQPKSAPPLHVVALATVQSTSARPTTPLPQGLRGHVMYWRVLKSAGAVSYQLCLGFFQTRDEAERARRQLLGGFPEARVIQVDAQERENLQKAARAAPAPAPAPAVAPPPAPVAPPALAP